jgi:hypothetical protein
MSPAVYHSPCLPSTHLSPPPLSDGWSMFDCVVVTASIAVLGMQVKRPCGTGQQGLCVGDGSSGVWGEEGRRGNGGGRRLPPLAWPSHGPNQPYLLFASIPSPRGPSPPGRFLLTTPPTPLRPWAFESATCMQRRPVPPLACRRRQLAAGTTVATTAWRHISSRRVRCVQPDRGLVVPGKEAAADVEGPESGSYPPAAAPGFRKPPCVV